MSKQKGRGGKKQRYSIADIGGGDLTSQDVSTERVLNFLIRGGITDVEGPDQPGDVNPEDLSSRVSPTPPPPQGRADAPSAADTPAPRRSLDHLFNRANRSDAAKGLNPPETTEESPALHTEQPLAETPPKAPDAVPACVDANLVEIELTATAAAHPPPFPDPEPGDGVDGIQPETLLVPEIQTETALAEGPNGPETAPAADKISAVPAPLRASVDDTLLLDRWKKKHRLSKGELKVLTVMLGLCREDGGNTCFIKIPQLMEDADLKERQTQLVIKNLRDLGLIEKLAEYSNADRRGTQYRVNLAAD